MKHLYIILVTLFFIGCNSEKRVLFDELMEKEGVYYFESKPYTGIVYGVYENGQLKEEGNCKDGEKDGLWKSYYENGQLKSHTNWSYGVIVSETCWDQDGNQIECK